MTCPVVSKVSRLTRRIGLGMVFLDPRGFGRLRGCWWVRDIPPYGRTVAPSQYMPCTLRVNLREEHVVPRGRDRVNALTSRCRLRANALQSSLLIGPE